MASFAWMSKIKCRVCTTKSYLDVFQWGSTWTLRQIDFWMEKFLKHCDVKITCQMLKRNERKCKDLLSETLACWRYSVWNVCMECSYVSSGHARLGTNSYSHVMVSWELLQNIFLHQRLNKPGKVEESAAAECSLLVLCIELTCFNILPSNWLVLRRCSSVACRRAKQLEMQLPQMLCVY